jgi:ribosomal protein S4
MILKKKNRFKPLYKQFIKLNENVQNRPKLFQFKKQKWAKLLNNLTYKLRNYNKFKPFTQTQYIASKVPNKWNSYKKGKHRQIMQTFKKFKLMYGNLSKKKIKKYLTLAYKKNKKLNLIFLKLFEIRLDTILYRAKFSTSIKSARQLIIHKKIFINNKTITSQNYTLKSGDIISIDPKYKHLIENNIANSPIWPIPPKHLIINYKTLQIILCNIETLNSNISSYFTFNLNLEKILLDYYNTF